MTDFSNLNRIISIKPWHINGTAMNQKMSKVTSEKVEETKKLKIKENCKEFESLFLNYLLKEMRETIPTSSLFNGGQAEQLYTAMYDERIAQELANHGGIGLAEMIEKSLLKNQVSESDH